MTVSELMVRDVISIEPDTMLFDAVKLMHEHDIRHLPVVDRGRLVGLVTNRDLRFLASRVSEADVATGSYSLSLEAKVLDVMAPDPIVTEPDVPLGEVLEIFLEEKIGAIPVVGEDEQLVGIIGYIDLLRHFRDRFVL